MAEDNVDLIVLKTFFADRQGGTFVEVGAAHPQYLSVSAAFRQRGWRIIAIEPNPEFCDIHRQHGYEVLEYACSDENRDGVDFTVVNSHGVDYLGGKVTAESISSLGVKDGFADLLNRLDGRATTKTISVKVRTLDNILSVHAPELREVDVVCVDVEGWELSVMKGLSLNHYRPKVVILENLLKQREYSDYMAQRGYVRWLELGLNEIYVRSELISKRVQVIGWFERARYVSASFVWRLKRTLGFSK